MTKYVKFVGESDDVLYKVVKETRRHILYYDTLVCDYVWERKEYIDKEYYL